MTRLDTTSRPNSSRIDVFSDSAMSRMKKNVAVHSAAFQPGVKLSST
jgi:hypothetical protein